MRTDIVDNVLPKDVKLDFALIDVETLEIKALDGMREVIKRSPNLVMFVEWTLQQHANKPLGKEIVEFLWEQGYTFYEQVGEN